MSARFWSNVAFWVGMVLAAWLLLTVGYLFGVLTHDPSVPVSGGGR